MLNAKKLVQVGSKVVLRLTTPVMVTDLERRSKTVEWNKGNPIIPEGMQCFTIARIHGTGWYVWREDPRLGIELSVMMGFMDNGLVKAVV